MRQHLLVQPPERPATGTWIPALAVRGTFLICGVLLSLLAYGVAGWAALGVALTVGAAFFPNRGFAWILILLLAAAPLEHPPHLTWQFLALLAGIHLLHALGTLILELPLHAWVQTGVLAALCRRYLAIQVGCQPLAIGIILLLSPSRNGHRPLTITAFALVGAIGLAGITRTLLRSHPERR